MEWTEEQREEVARHFRNVARGWRKWEDLGCGDRSVLWPECMSCHRIDTVTRAENAGESGSSCMWQCSRCDAVTSERDIWLYETSLLLDVTKLPDCSQLLLSLFERCAHMLFLFSRGEVPDGDAAGNAARQAARVLDQFGMDEDWFHLIDPREAVSPDDFDTAFTQAVRE